MSDPIFTKLDMHLMTLGSFPMANLINPFHKFVCLSIPTFRCLAKARKTLSLHKKYTIKRTVGGVDYCSIHVVSKERLWVYLCVLPLLSNGSVDFFRSSETFLGCRFMCGPSRIKGK
jgi:hypothetical protein